jgi:hypothetical protein
MFYYIYKITNNANQKYYIGAHKTTNINDNYFGSGVALKRAIEKYGKENFTKEIICFCKTENDMYIKEKELVILNENSYNMTRESHGGFSHIDIFGDNNIMRKSKEAREKVSIKMKQIRNDPFKKNYLNSISKRNLEKAILKNTGKKRPEHSILMKQKGQLKEKWDKDKENMRNKLSSYFEVTSPDNIKYITNRLEDFCKENNLSYTTLWKTSKTNISPKKGKSKGWICKKILAP